MGKLQEILESLIASKSVRHTYIDESEKIPLGSRSVFEVRASLESSFRLALPEAETVYTCKYPALIEREQNNNV